MNLDLEIDLDWTDNLGEIEDLEDLLEADIELPEVSRTASTAPTLATKTSTSYTSEKISIRINKALLERIKAQATELGRPYQTHINSLLTAAVHDLDRSTPVSCCDAC